MNTPNKKSEIYECKHCSIVCSKQSDWNRHVATTKHKKRENIENITNQNAELNCAKCNRTYSSQYELDKHLKTKYHNTDDTEHKCSECNKIFKTYNSMWYHKKRCSNANDNTNSNDAIQILISENKELKDFLIEQSKEYMKTLSEQTKETNLIVNKVLEIATATKQTNCNNNIVTNNNNKFNVNVFLDTECKDAMNFEDFVNGIEVSREDIQNNGRLGFVDGISKIIMDNLNRLSVHQRPIHCTDWKREVLYIKDDNKWTKETDAKKIRDAIQIVSQKSIRTLHDWKMSNPDYKRGSSDFAMECIDMQLHSVAGYHREVYYPKVAKLVAKHVLVDKKN
jgi:hypothetical protein